uniref:Uncharacterized protein MANES_01G020400 n=1 Tax=Rhizophora mucronata TaxID=61149 RepID=A0A2P2L5S8_RHIMU
MENLFTIASMQWLNCLSWTIHCFRVLLSGLLFEKVLLGESPGCELANIVPSKSGLQTVMEVLKIQINFWTSLGSSLTKLQSQWRAQCFENQRKQIKIKKKRRAEVPIWWKWGRKRLLYYLLKERIHANLKRVAE